VTDVEIVAVVVFAIPVLTLIGFIHWWLRAFPMPPLLPLQQNVPPVRSPYLKPSDFGNVQYMALSATCASAFSWTVNQ